MEYTKGEFQAIGSSKAKFKDAYFIRLKDTEDSFIAKTYGHTGFPAEANAKELVRRWNAFEEGGIVDELKGRLENLIKQPNCEGCQSEAEAALAKC